MLKVQPDEAAFTNWVGAALTPVSTVFPGSASGDLEPLGHMIGDATVVALGEGVHLGSEPLEFRNRVLQYLVQDKAFTAIAIESGIVESRIVHDYVRGAEGDLSENIAQGISWTFDRLPQNRALVSWLRQHNSEPRAARKVNFYGFDVPGSPCEPKANRGLDTPLRETLRYLTRVDPAAAAAFQARFEPVLTFLQFELDNRGDAIGYEGLTRSVRDACSAAIADLITLLETREAAYITASALDDYQWAHRTAIGARQVDNFLRQFPPGWRAAEDELAFLFAAGDVRDRAQADNLDWILRREGPAGRVLVYAHNSHLTSAPLKTTSRLIQTDRDQEPSVRTYWHQVAGTYLRRRLGARLVTIGNAIGCGDVSPAGIRQTVTDAPAGSIDEVLARLATPRFLLDLRKAPIAVRAWLEEERPCGQRTHVFEKYELESALPSGNAFDVLFYLDKVTAVSPWVWDGT